jgi:hypothetical protein
MNVLLLSKYLIVLSPFQLKEALCGFSLAIPIAWITTLALWDH